MDIFISSSLKGKNFKEIVEFATEKNLNLEISRFGSLKTLDEEIKERIKEHKNNLKNFGGKISVHGFFSDLNMSAKDPDVLKITKKRFNQSFEIAKELGAVNVVFHTGYNAILKHQGYFESFVQKGIEFWGSEIEKFEKEKITVSLENTYEDRIDGLINIVDEINSPYLKICLDTGHANINSDGHIIDWIQSAEKRIVHTHFHNNFAKKDEHNSLLKGTLDFDLILKTFAEKEINPRIVLEIFNLEMLEESLKYLKNKGI